MGVVNRLLTAAAGVVLVAASLTMTAPPAHALDYNCPAGDDPYNFTGVFDPVPPVYMGGRSVELRYSRTNQCAWGRILSGVPGDKIWVDWSRTAGGQHAPWAQLGVTQINTGGSKYTNAFNDRGYYMRACGKPINTALVCTGWY